MKTFKQILSETVGRQDLDEISNDLKKKYLDKAIPDYQKRYNEPAGTDHLTPSGKKLKKSWINSAEYKRANNKLKTRFDMIQKARKDIE